MKNRSSLKLALFGTPIEHSLSPRIHQAFARQSGIEVDYALIDCPRGELEAPFRAFAQAGGTGCNLTVPVKAEGMALADSLTPAAARAGAVNVLVRTETGWLGDNTDGAGLLADLDRMGVGVTGSEILVIGTGGAAAGILGPVLERAPASLWICGRQPEQAAAMAGRAGKGKVHATGLERLDQAREFDLVIHATSAGQTGQVPGLDRLHTTPGAVVYDLNYGCAHRALAEWAASRGLLIYDGLGMLVEQAALSFLRFSGRRPDTAGIVDELRAIDAPDR